tara:strand:- start:1451 stop:4915 length:3465 start_codon:yes stop_codon:yes gene_type:complete
MTGSAILIGDKGNNKFLQFIDNTLTVRGDLGVDQLLLPATIMGQPSSGSGANTNASSSLDSSGYLKTVSASIGGWLVGEDEIRGGNLILGKSGFIQSSDYAFERSGFIITNALNGYAEFENARIRGTLATTTFEKESVNAVGGQMFVANSTALSGSEVRSSEVSMSLKNVSGFTKDEILLIKKVSDTGFNTEYAKVISSSRFKGGGDNDPDGLAGHLFLQRGHGFFTRSSSIYYGGQGEGASASTLQTWQNKPSGELLPLKFSTGSRYGVSSFRLGNTGYLYSTGSDSSGSLVLGNQSVSASLHVHLTGSVIQVGDGTSLSLQMFPHHNSSSILLEEHPFWKTSNGAVKIDRDFYFTSSAANFTGAGQKRGKRVGLGIFGVTDSTNDSQLRLRVTASVDRATIESVQLGASGSVGDPIGGPDEYKEGQVVVSTGRYISGTGSDTVGSGYIRLNANPSNAATPYMDIIERTGSGIYDVDLKVRLGDLTGLTTAEVGDNPRFGLFTENAFLTNQVVVGTLATEHIKIDGTSMLFKDGNNTQAELRGTTWTLGGAHGTTDDVVVIAPTAGVKIHDSSTNFVQVDSNGLFIHSGNASNPSAHFSGEVELYANGGTDRTLHITQHGINIGPAATGPSSANTPNAVAGNISAHAQGVRIYGTATDDYVDVKSDGVDVVAANKTQASFGATTKIGVDENDSTFVQIDSDSVDIIEDVSGTNATVASFGVTTTIGQVANSKSRLVMTSDAVRIVNKDSGGTDTTMIEFNSAGTITAADYLIEKSRLFGAGGDGTVVLRDSTAIVSDGGNGAGSASGGTGVTDRDSVEDANGTTVCTRSGTVWTMQGDWYTFDLTLFGSATLKTNGFRLYVFGTFECDGAVDCSGTAGASGGAGTNSGTLVGGVEGGNGGAGGASDSTNAAGGNGGHGGGGGGIIFISARNIIGEGSIKAEGGAGQNGTSGGTKTSALSGTVGSAGAIGGTAAAASATTRIDVIDPHIVQMMRDVMNNTNVATRLTPSGGSAGGGGGGASSPSNASSTGNAGTKGDDATAASNCIVGGTCGAGGAGGAGGTGAGGPGGGGSGGNGGAVVIISTTVAAISNAYTGTITDAAGDVVNLSAAGGAKGDAGTITFANAGSGPIAGTQGGSAGDGSNGLNGKLVYIQV